MIDLFAKRIGTILKKYTNTFSAKAKLLTNPKKIANELFKAGQARLKGLLGNPEALEDYVRTGTTYIAKKIIVMGVITIMVLMFVFTRYIFPWAEGRFWTPIIVLNSDKFFAYSGSAKVVTADHRLIYEGDMTKGRIVGEGRLYDEEGALVYQGGFLNEKYHGTGEKFTPDGILIYQGEFVRNLYHGEGQLYQNSALIYQGQFQKGLYHGSGSLYHPNGRIKLQGEFAGGKLNGEGRLYSENGQLIYQGRFVDGQYDGIGIEYNQATGRVIYEGQFSKGLYQGIGKLYDQELGRLKYDGKFQQGVFSGEGSLYNWMGQNIYTGYFYNGDIDYMRYIDASVATIRKEFGQEDEATLYPFHFCLVYREFGVMFAFQYEEIAIPVVSRMIFLGEQDFFGASKGIPMPRLAALNGESDSEFYYLIDEEKSNILKELHITEPLDQLYSTRYLINDELFVRYYALHPGGEVLYFEMGGL